MILVVNDNDDNHNQRYHSKSYSPIPFMHSKNHKSNSNNAIEEIKEPAPPILKRLLIVDHEPNVALTFKASLDGYCYYHNKDRVVLEIYTYNDPLDALSNFKPHFYDLMLIDINIPKMNGLELCQKIIGIDPNVRVCFMSPAELNIRALREVYSKVSFGCFIKKPITIEDLVKRLLVELEW